KYPAGLTPVASMKRRHGRGITRLDPAAGPGPDPDDHAVAQAPDRLRLQGHKVAERSGIAAGLLAQLVDEGLAGAELRVERARHLLQAVGDVHGFADQGVFEAALVAD